MNINALPDHQICDFPTFDQCLDMAFDTEDIGNIRALIAEIDRPAVQSVQKKGPTFRKKIWTRVRGLVD